jgi:hypothetical protein
VDFTPIRQLFGITEECGYPEETLAPWIERFGAVPEVLRRYFTTLGAHKELNQHQDHLVIPDGRKPSYCNISEDLDHGHLVFYEENQGACFWGIRAADVALPDPPVYESGRQGWRQVAGSVSEFLLSMAHVQAALGLPFSEEESWEVTDEQAARIAEIFPSKRADFALWNGVRFYGDRPDTVIMLMRGGDTWQMYFSSRDRDAYEDLVARLTQIVDSDDNSGATGRPA